jgi:sulfate transport system permease protein
MIGPTGKQHHSAAAWEPAWLRRSIAITAAAFLALFLLLPLAAVFAEGLRRGWGVFAASVASPDALSAIRLTLVTAAVAVPLNALFGILAAWALARFRFPGRSVLAAMIDLPFAVPPVIAGLIFVLLFGSRGWLGGWLSERGIQIIYAPAGIIIATVFITFPFVARELIPLMREQGSDEEVAALSLGAGWWQTFRRVTLPNVRWALLYGLILCNARAMGEFGAVSIVSGHIRGETNTLPLHVEILYNEYDFAGSFAAASLLASLAVVTLIVKSLVEWKVRRDRAAAAAEEH